MHRLIIRLFLAAGLSLPAAVATAQNAAKTASKISVELNKLETVPNACRGYFVIGNGTADGLKELRLDVFLFDKAGVILRRVGLNFTGIRPERSKVVLFDIPEVACGEIGRLIVNDVLACTGSAGAPLADCATLVTTSTRAEAAFVY
jgi:hypothetical protein